MTLQALFSTHPLGIPKQALTPSQPSKIGSSGSVRAPLVTISLLGASVFAVVVGRVVVELRYMGVFATSFWS